MAEAPSWKVLADMGVASLRQLGEGDAAQAAARELGLPWPARPLQVAGTEPCWLAWRGPQETIALARERKDLRPLLEALAPGRDALALAIDLSEALVVVELAGPSLDEWLAHLVDASAIPRQGGCASRARLADIAVLLLRMQAQQLWLVAERPLLPYLEDWLGYARDGAFGADTEHEEFA